MTVKVCSGNLAFIFDSRTSGIVGIKSIQPGPHNCDVVYIGMDVFLLRDVVLLGLIASPSSEESLLAVRHGELRARLLGLQSFLLMDSFLVSKPDYLIYFNRQMFF